MKEAARRPVLVPAMILYAALAAPSTVALGGEEPVVPFPGTSVSGTRVSGPSVSGTSVFGAVADGRGITAESPLPGAEGAGPVAEAGAPDTAAGDETKAPDAGAEVPGTAGPDVDGEPSDAAVPDDAMAPARVSAAKADVPAGGSRLLRALVELSETPVPGDAGRPGAPRVSGTSVPGTRVSGTSVMAGEGCPRALLRRLLAGAAGEADALSALGIEREILTLCRERQEILAGLFEAEARLSELREAGRRPQTPVTAASAGPAPRMGAPGEVPAAGTSAPSALRASLGGAAETPDTRAGDTRAAEPQVLARVSPRYVWFSIIGTAGALRAGVTDGTGVWFVREGDPLPGGATVTAIAARPPGVRVTFAGETLVPESGEAVLLPFGARPGSTP